MFVGKIMWFFVFQLFLFKDSGKKKKIKNNYNQILNQKKNDVINLALTIFFLFSFI